MESTTKGGNQITTEPLVSIIVITYNSSKYVLETLESAKEQTYRNIELIVTDDCSTDNTVELCRNWIEENKSRFVNTELVTVEKNTGIPANYNRGLKASKGEWIKGIAGDDMFLPDCVADFIQFASNNLDSKLFISRMLTLQNGIITKTQMTSCLKKISETNDPKEQYKAILISYFGNSPSLFVSREIYNTVKFDEKFRFLEDYPFALNATKSGFSFVFFDKETVIYRKHESSVFASIEKDKLFNKFYINRLEFDKTYRYPYLPKKQRKKEQFEYNRLKLIDALNLNHRNIFCRIINRITKKLNPYT
ncbi:MAG: glycosyltransferase [Mariniphaga sp.]